MTVSEWLIWLTDYEFCITPSRIPTGFAAIGGVLAGGEAAGDCLGAEVFGVVVICIVWRARRIELERAR